jgi:hypothetical protein
MVVKINGLTYRYHSGKKSGYMGHGAIKWETTMFLREAIGKDKEPTSLHSQFLSKLNMKHTSTFRFKKKTMCMYTDFLWNTSVLLMHSHCQDIFQDVQLENRLMYELVSKLFKNIFTDHPLCSG